MVYTYFNLVIFLWKKLFAGSDWSIFYIIVVMYKIGLLYYSTVQNILS